jgi:preprotein translocase subunit SecG
MQTFITIIYVIVAFMMVLAILLQAGKGGGLGSALGGGASQSVFGGGGSGDFMAKMTQGFAATFMISAMYLAYASAHAGSEFLEAEDTGTVGLLDADEPVDFERIGNNPQPLPTVEEGKAMQAKASALVPAQSGGEEPALETPEPTPSEKPEQPESKTVDNPVPAPTDGSAPTQPSELGPELAPDPKPEPKPAP